ncbi:hypothetical protein B0H34DRAFT_739725 [Crassisporium funariophilum]|nr:hypothetical protein B0H34DRAFT_739725 [Crassisporium funariophilum]
MPKIPRKKSSKPAGKTTEIPEQPSYAEAHRVVSEGKRKHGKSQKTTTNYDGHIRRGKEFLACFVREEREAEKRWRNGDDAAQNLCADGEDDMPTGQEAQMDPHFHEAFTGSPAKCTPVAIAMFLAHKCLTEDYGKSTASAIHAAFLNHYEQMAGDKFRGRWRFDNVLNEWVGSPVRSAEVEDMLEACKNKDGEGERKHSRAMSIDDMQKFLQNFKLKCPVVDPTCSHTDHKKMIMERGSYLLFNALSSSAYTIWMRIGEATNLQVSNFEFLDDQQPERSPPGPCFFRLNLRNRKNWQKREKSGEHQLNGHVYDIYPQPRTPEIDMYSHLLDWLRFYTTFLLGRPLRPDDYVFPMIGSNGLSVHPDRPMSSEIAQKKITHMAKQAGIHGADLFTTHCFRRGGAQYRFMFAPIGQRWTLARIRWWGGWAQGEHRDTLIRYLLDELYTYEEDHSNALKPFDQHSCAGEAHTPPNTAGLQDFVQEVRLGFQEIKTSLAVPSIASPNQLLGPGVPRQWVHQHQDTQHNMGPTTTSTNHLQGTVYHQTNQPPPLFVEDHQSAASRPVGDTTFNEVHIIPASFRGKCSTAWEQVATDWEEADPTRSLYVAMKDWEPQWYKSQSQKYGQRKTIALEFVEYFNRDKARFTAAYPEHQRGITPLLIAIRSARQARGDCEIRPTRRKDHTN